MALISNKKPRTREPKSTWSKAPSMGGRASLAHKGPASVRSPGTMVSNHCCVDKLVFHIESTPVLTHLNISKENLTVIENIRL